MEEWTSNYYLHTCFLCFLDKIPWTFIPFLPAHTQQQLLLWQDYHQEQPESNPSTQNLTVNKIASPTIIINKYIQMDTLRHAPERADCESWHLKQCVFLVPRHELSYCTNACTSTEAQAHAHARTSKVDFLTVTEMPPHHSVTISATGEQRETKMSAAVGRERRQKPPSWHLIAWQSWMEIVSCPFPLILWRESDYISNIQRGQIR